MRLLVMHPGADMSTADVYDGLVPALRRLGHTVFDYPLSRLLNEVSEYLSWLDRRAKKRDPSTKGHTDGDVQYRAAERALPLALWHEVDWVLVVSGMFVLKEWLILMRRAGLRIGLLLTESPYDDERQARWAPHADIVWTNERLSVDVLKAANPNTHYLPHAYDPEKHQPGEQAGDAEVRAHDVVFVGSGFTERVELLSAVDWSGIDFGLYGTWRGLPASHRLRRHLYGGFVSNAKAAALYRRAKIGLNLYRTSIGFGGQGHIASAESLNPRALELAACGVFHLSTPRAEVTEVFGTLVPTFRDAQQLGALLRHFLQNERGRRLLVNELPARVADRTFDHMARRIDGDLGWTRATQPYERGERVK